jgi:hypothetical protein
MPADDLHRIFPKLAASTYHITSPIDPFYNCIAWAARDIERLWWPFAYPPMGYWPEGIDRNETVECFIAASATLGFVPCENGDLEVGLEKLVIYASGAEVTHMARQLVSGAWTSKLGRLEDIEHEALEAINCDDYGEPVQFLRRPLSPATG